MGVNQPRPPSTIVSFFSIIGVRPPPNPLLPAELKKSSPSELMSHSAPAPPPPAMSGAVEGAYEGTAAAQRSSVVSVLASFHMLIERCVCEREKQAEDGSSGGCGR